MDMQGMIDSTMIKAGEAMTGRHADGLDRLAAKKGRAEEPELRQACEGFETMFVAKLWEKMRSTVQKEASMHGKQEDKYLALFDQGFAEHIVSAGGVGLGRMLFESLRERLAEASTQTRPAESSPVGLGNGSSSGETVRHEDRSDAHALLKASELADRIVALELDKS
ncbi:MAG: hypothetical protein EOM25_03645 [Deltaproteobacteria bacterium]|nr:hypothetical protein [Deltaproteobacteria bacterium]